MPNVIVEERKKIDRFISNDPESLEATQRYNFESHYAFKKALYLLHQHHLLTQDTRHFLSKFPDPLSKVEWLVAVVGKNIQPEAMKKILSLLINNELTQENLPQEKVKALRKKVHDIIYSINVLNTGKILFDEQGELQESNLEFLKKVSVSPEKVAAAFVVLYNGNILTDSSRSYVKNTQNPVNIASALVELDKIKNLFTADEIKKLWRKLPFVKDPLSYIQAYLLTSLHLVEPHVIDLTKPNVKIKPEKNASRVDFGLFSSARTLGKRHSHEGLLETAAPASKMARSSAS